MITSKSNSRIKWFRRLQADRQFRHREKIFVAEGNRWLKEIDFLNIRPQAILATRKWLEQSTDHSLFNENAENVWLVSEQVMDHTSTMETPPGVLMALNIPAISLPESLTMLLILDGINNPGNLGTILRTSSAAGIEGVLLAPGCVDPYNPKVIRGGMGAQLRLPIHQAGWSEISTITRNLQVWLASPHGSIGYTEVDWKQPSALIAGSEASGHGESAGDLSANRTTIPMNPGVESLNVAVATGIILFEIARQRSFF